MRSCVLHAAAHVSSQVPSFITASGDALTWASNLVEEVAWQAICRHTLAAAAAVLVPGLGSRAGDFFGAIAEAFARVEVPVEVVGTSLL